MGKLYLFTSKEWEGKTGYARGREREGKRRRKGMEGSGTTHNILA